MKNTNRTNKMAITVTILLVLTLFLSACTKKTAEPITTNIPEATASGSAATTEAPVETNPYKEHLDITWIGFNWGGAMVDDNNPTKKIIEEKFNVTITSPAVDINNMEQFNLYLAEGKSADYMFYPYDNTKLIKDGVFRELDADDMRAKMPNWFKVLENDVPEDVWKAKIAIDGKYYYTPIANYNSFTPTVSGVRKDWMDNVGITEFPKTMAEYHDMLLKFTTEDPDKNGKNDTYGTDGIGAYMYAAYGLGVRYGLDKEKGSVGHFVDDAGKINAIAISDSYKEMLTTLASWYKEGIIDPEFITDTRELQRTKWESSKIGVLSDHPDWFRPSQSGNMSDLPKKSSPNANVQIMGSFTGPYGNGTSSVNFSPIDLGFYVGKDTSDAKLDRVYAINDYMVADNDFYNRIYFGEEGKTYTKAANGTILYTEAYNTAAAQMKEGLSTYYAYKPIDLAYANKFLLDPEKDVPIYDLAKNLKVYYGDVNFKFSGTNNSFTAAEKDLLTIVQEYLGKAVSGQSNLTTDWDKYKKAYLKAGGQKVIDEYQALFDKSK